MNVTTFYSFKGGVGRSLALANVAYELARTGSQVLVVDFDLEAPGVDTTLGIARSQPTRGLVDLVRAYLAGSEPPDVRDYVYEVGEFEVEPGRIMVMPAGLQNDAYAHQLSGIDWVGLYRDSEGYLLFEDLKAQWEAQLGVDYVLIDSRTGHTDVTGICTRQLPDTVMVLFFPNEQNLRGLTKVVGDIRSEPERTGRDKINLIFVASNVPHLDDEESILERRMRAFQQRLRINDGQIQVVHHYDSLALLEHPLFTRHRPKTRLARQYRKLTRLLRMSNIEDRVGALEQLEHPYAWRDYTGSEVFLERLSRIESTHSMDGEILYKAGMQRSKLGQIEEARGLFFEALRSGFHRPEVHLALAESYQRLGQVQRAAEAVSSALADSSASLEVILRTVHLLRLIAREKLTDLLGSPAVHGLTLEERIRLASQLDHDLDEVAIARQLLAPMVYRAEGREDWLPEARFELGKVLLALGQHFPAEEQFANYLSGRPESLPALFNLGMARWGSDSSPDTKLFRRVLDLPVPSSFRGMANFHQCFALANHIAGNDEDARDHLATSRRLIEQKSGREFTCWRFLSVSTEAFLEDLAAIESRLDGRPVRPRFMEPTQASIPFDQDSEA